MGGGLAGLGRRHQDRRNGRRSRPVLDRPGEALALRLRAGRHQRCQESQGRRRLHLAAFRRHDLRRRLPRQPASGQSDVRGAPGDHRSARSHGRAPSTALPKACSISAASAARSINRTAFAGATTGQQLLYALDEQVRRYESEGKVKKYEHWEFLSAVLDGNRVLPWHLRDGPAHHGSAHFPR